MAQRKYGLHGKLTAKAGKRDELAEILLKAADAVSGAKGCRVYIISTDPSDKNSAWVTEVWDSKADHDDSLQSPDVKSLISQAIPLLGEKPGQGQVLEVWGGAGISVRK